MRVCLPLSVSVAMVAVMSSFVSAQRPASFQVGQPFPPLVLPSLADGKPGSIADFRGKKLILHIFASW